jgi:outer membrane lipase/esterase
MEEDKSMYTHIRAILITLLVSTTGNVLADNEQLFSGIHAFGTSLSDEGNAFIACGGQSLPPYDNLPSFLNAAPGDSPYARGGHHFSNGSTWVDALAKSLGVNNSALPVRQNPVGTNYAQAGTTAIPGGPLGPLPCRVSFAEQIAEALARGGIPDDALVTVEIGSNDVINAVLFFVSLITDTGNPVGIPAAKAITIDTVLKNAADYTFGEDPDPTVLGIYDLIVNGASKLLWTTVPDIGLTPSMAILDAQLQGFGFPEGLIIGTATEFADTYNSFVEADIQSAINDGTIDDGIIVKFDLFQILQEIVLGGNGELNVTDACVMPNQPPFTCMVPDSYLFWDGIHPTKVTHDFFAEKAMEELSPQ